MSQPKYESHKNSFGFLRLLLASLVILSHTPEIYDGNRSREILTNVFGSISFGEFAVDGFFLISGYLISASYIKTPSAASYLTKRIFRIYPAFVASFLVCVLVVAPLGGGGSIEFTPQYVLNMVARMLVLYTPISPTAFQGTYYPDLNGAMWTIPYEFKCYLLVLALGLLGILKKKRVILALAIFLLILSCICPEQYRVFVQEAAARTYSHSFVEKGLNLVIGDPRSTIRLAGIFLCGAAFQVYKDRLIFNRKWIAISSVALVALLFEPRTANLAVAVFGGYLMLAFASLGGKSITSRINNEDDISYGVYLYAFPITKLILWYQPGMNILLVGVLTLIGAAIMGTVSWRLLEKPIMYKIQRNAPSAAGVVT